MSIYCMSKPCRHYINLYTTPFEQHVISHIIGYLFFYYYYTILDTPNWAFQDLITNDEILYLKYLKILSFDLRYNIGYSSKIFYKSVKNHFQLKILLMTLDFLIKFYFKMSQTINVLRD